MTASSLTTSSAGKSPKVDRKAGRAERAIDSDEELTGRSRHNSRSRLDSGSSDQPRTQGDQAGESVASKSSSSSRPRQDSIRRRENNNAGTESATSTPRRAATQRQKPAHLKTVDAFVGSKVQGGGQFRVANVGMGGRIYLRPVIRPSPQQQQQQQSHQTSLPQSPTRGPARSRVEDPSSRRYLIEEEDHTQEDDDRGDEDSSIAPSLAPGAGVRTDFTGRESVWTKLSTTQDPRAAPSDIFRHRPRSRRSMSESTVDKAPLVRPPALAQTKAFKVVIDRPDSDPQSQRQRASHGDVLRSLDVPIPNYKAGSSRLGEKVAPPFHSSMYAHASTHGVSGASSTANMKPASSNGSPAATRQSSPLMTAQSQPGVAPRRHSHASPYTNSVASVSHDSAVLSSSLDPFAPSHNPTITGADIISPSIYDLLASSPNNPSVVKYSGSGEVVAATPARLIVQITAETFLDYELLSDFFLTVRSYLTTHDLLALLLARFEWAVNRQDDNGRIITVRSFAAIRHWILNYFAYDFAPDRRLRVQFCRKLNAIFKTVQSREELGADIKLIADLKKCWNGRCVMYWDRPVDNALEADILPGGSGPHNKTDSEVLEEMGELGLGSVTAASTDIYSIPGSPRPEHEAGSSQESSILSASQGHTRTTSGVTSKSGPLSSESELDTGKSSSKAAYSTRQGAAAGAPESLSTSRDSSEMGSEAPSAERQQAAAYRLQSNMYRSVLRGHLLAPASPYVTTGPTTPGLTLRQMSTTSNSPREVEALPGKKTALSGSSSGPGMKNLIGNIKRALGSKTSSVDPYDSEIVMMGNGPVMARQQGSAQRLEGYPRTAPLPPEVVNPYGPSNSTTENVRATLRIDMLAEQIAVEFHKAVQGRYNHAPGTEQRKDSATSESRTLDTRAQDATSSDQGRQQLSVGGFLKRPELAKLPSGMTSSSQSIVIFDDTGANQLSSVPGGSEDDRTPRVSAQLEQSGLEGSQEQHGTGLLAPSITTSGRVPAGDGSTSGQEPAAQQAAFNTVPAHVSYISSSHLRQPSQGGVSLRRVASYQSTLSRFGDRSAGPSASMSRQSSAMGGIGADPTTASFKASTHAMTSAGPARGLRRVPGGDLRANNNIADLELHMRPRSEGSISINTFSSTRESEMLSFGDRITKTFKRDRTDRPLISPGITGGFDPSLKDEKEAPKKVSYIRTNSEDKSNRRPSFEAVVASFAEIPDEDEGGIEATLLKLEGRYRKGAITKANKAAAVAAAAAAKPSDEQQASKLAREKSTGSNDTVHQEGTTGEAPESKSHPKLADRTTTNTMTTEYAGSEDSFNSQPLLERGADSMLTPKAKGKAASSPRPSARARDATKSFLLDPNEDDSGSSDGEGAESVESDKTRDANTRLQPAQPPSPPMSDGNARWKQAENDGQSVPQPERKPPTPDPSPSRQFVEPHLGHAGGPTSIFHPAVHTPLTAGMQPHHLPFVLGHDSDLVCQQLTLIEKDALREIDWRDLVDMRWQQHASTITNWVAYLTSQDPLGIDMVTARFNVMVKWVLSEIVLTDGLEERALTIIKFIHVARSARRTCNYATLLQLTIALTSTDCMRLKSTWELVPSGDRETLRELEALVSPRRNFAALRSEMEDAPADHGCIPVLALYIHDLTYNAQKPALIEGAPAGDGPTMLVNFERYRSTAVIVKNLLRLIDASSRYNYVPVDDVLSHCMWIACLPDADITKRSRALEGIVVGGAGAGAPPLR